MNEVSASVTHVTPRLIKRATTILIFLGFGLIATTAYLFGNLRDRQTAVMETVREDAMWAVFQTHRETSRLVEAILIAQMSQAAEAIAKVNLNFDLVYSRMTLLGSGLFSENFNQDEELRIVTDALQDDIKILAKALD